MDVTFDHNPLKGDGIVNLFLGMKENPNSKVKRLSLRYCEAYGDFCETLVPLLGENKTLTYVVREKKKFKFKKIKIIIIIFFILYIIFNIIFFFVIYIY